MAQLLEARDWARRGMRVASWPHKAGWVMVAATVSAAMAVAWLLLERDRDAEHRVASAPPMTENEYRQFLDQRIRSRMGIGLDEFMRQLNGGRLPETPATWDLKALVGAAAATPKSPITAGR